jgi:hypothetical protein
MELIESKSLLAKLMATENLIVEQRQVSTAMFDVTNRILILPILDNNISPYLYDLFCGHEVGHALYTPEDGTLKATALKLSKSLMNVLEDSRIERKIKNKYPGIRASFVRGYSELIQKDFFGTANVDLNTLNFIDRVNLYCKGGPSQGIKFNEEETVLLKEVESTQTYDDVIELALKINHLMKEQVEEAEKRRIESGDKEEDEKFDNEGYKDSEEETEEMEFKPNSPEGSSYDEETPQQTDEAEESEQGGTDGAGVEGHNEIKSHTDEVYERNQSKLYANTGKEYYYGNIPSINLNKMIIPYKQLWKRYKAEASEYSIDTEGFQKTRKDSTKVVSYLAKEFEMRKNADQMKRTSIAKTGELNMSKIYSYVFNEDIFKKATVVAEGKSHGLVMFLDWSGSMTDNINNTVKQLINLTLFCKKVNIPFDVYAFSSEYNSNDWIKETWKEGNIYLDKCNLLNILSNKMSASEYSYACSALLYMTSGRHRLDWFCLGGTPLNEAIIAAMEIIPEFKKQYKLQLVNAVFLTDGEGHGGNMVYRNLPVESIPFNDAVTHTAEEQLVPMRGLTRQRYGSCNEIFVIRDPKTKNQVILNEGSGQEKITGAFLKLLKQRTGCNVVGFYILSSRDFRNAIWRYFPKLSNTELLRSEFRKNNFAVSINAGYDEYYFIRTEGMNTDDEVELEVKENATTRGLVSAFSKYTKGRLTNRVVLNRFIGMIA